MPRLWTEAGGLLGWSSMNEMCLEWDLRDEHECRDGGWCRGDGAGSMERD